MNLLLVDDDQSYLDLLQSMLKNNKNITKTYYAKNGLEALELTTRYKIDFILTDVDMPIIDGLEFCQRFRATNKETPVCFISDKILMNTDHVKTFEGDFFLSKKALTKNALNQILNSFLSGLKLIDCLHKASPYFNEMPH